MGNFSTNVFLVIFMWNLWSCSNANGLNGCECNIMDACNAQGNPKSNWTQYLPSGVDKFRYVVRGAQNLAYLCENRKYAYAVAILFDCNSRIPLYAATVMTGQQLSAGKIPRPDEFEQSNEVKMTYQSKADDYHRPKRPEPWKAKPNCANPKETSEKIDRGHLIASQYGRGDKKRMAATFTYTNIVPQFGRFNNGPWNKCESRLIKWGQKNCARNGAQNVKLFIVVGAIPSTVNAPTIPGKPKFFGKRGFCDKQDNADYRVNVPKLLWTAACCTFEEDVNGNWTTGTHSTAFWGQNVPGGSSCEKIDIPALINKLSGMIRGKIKLFPLSSQCYNNYIPL